MPDKMIIPDHVGYLTAFRAWKWTSMKDGRIILGSVAVQDEWKPLLRHEALCGDLRIDQSYHDNLLNCQCGIHSYKDMQNVLKQYGNPESYIYGEIALWGRIAIHELGYRAQYGYPLAILRLPGQDMKTLRAAANTYKVKVKGVPIMHNINLKG